MCFKKQNTKYPMDKLGGLTKHHLRPRSRGGNNDPRNISFVPHKLHEYYHLLFKNMTPTQIAYYLNQHFIDPDYKMIVVSTR